MKYFIIVLVLIVSIFWGPSAQAFTLVCNINPVTDNQGDYFVNYPKRFLESVMPPKQIFVIDLNKKTAFDKRFKIKVNLTTLNEKRIAWSYSLRWEASRNLNFGRIVYKYIYFRKTKKFIAHVDPGSGYVGIRSTRSNCVKQ